MPHVPSGRIEEGALLGFEAALQAQGGEAYDREAWLYVPPFYADYRYVLGTRGERPLICVGLNPSTAAPGALDNTLKSVQRVAAHNGYDSFLMMNLYPQRATRPCDMDPAACAFLHAQNLRAFHRLLEQTRAVWAAWGAVIRTRGYLDACARDFLRAGRQAGAQWLAAGLSKEGHPRHPLYLRKDTVLEPFDAAGYAQRWLRGDGGGDWGTPEGFAPGPPGQGPLTLPGSGGDGSFKQVLLGLNNEGG